MLVSVFTRFFFYVQARCREWSGWRPVSAGWGRIEKTDRCPILLPMYLRSLWDSLWKEGEMWEGLSRIWHLPHRDLRLTLRDMFLCQECNCQFFILCHGLCAVAVAMCVCVKHVIVGAVLSHCCLALPLGLQAIIFSQSFCIILEVCIRLITICASG